MDRSETIHLGKILPAGRKDFAQLWEENLFGIENNHVYCPSLLFEEKRCPGRPIKIGQKARRSDLTGHHKMYINVHMKMVSFTEFRKNAASYFNSVEKGETIRISRHGKPVAEIIPVAAEERIPAWKRPGLRLNVKGVSLSREIIREREESD
jgi:prevent-host-death family protein